MPLWTERSGYNEEGLARLKELSPVFREYQGERLRTAAIGAALRLGMGMVSAVLTGALLLVIHRFAPAWLAILAGILTLRYSLFL